MQTTISLNEGVSTPLGSIESPVLARLNVLLAAGYHIDVPTSAEVKDAIWLNHPSYGKFSYSTLILYPSGLLVGSTVHLQCVELRLNPDEENEFVKFILTVPQANLWELNRWWVMRLVVYGVLLAMGFSLAEFVRRLFGSVF